MNFNTLLTVILLMSANTKVNAGVVSGKIIDIAGKPLSNVSVSLLYPSDSTMATFAITNKEGVFAINDAKELNYILQAANTGYYTEYIGIKLDQSNSVKIVEDIVLYKIKGEQNLSEVVISGERIPIKINGDTIEYNAGSYRVKPNAPVEDLLRQLPGVEVDEKGNIKSMGKDVKKVLVDGKDFFGTDPKIATKNLPADAIDKIQTFGKHSDQSEFSGIDDGTRDQTINLLLKEGKRKGYFGDVKAALGYPDCFDAGAKLFQFRPKKQMAVLGNSNNINQFGFSFDDYINFNGGIGNLMNGGRLDNLQDMPIDFGQAITGKNTSGALGLNYSMEIKPKNRLGINFISNGLYKTQDNKTDAKNYLPSGSSYESFENETLKRENLTNNLNMTWRNQLDSSNQFTLNLNTQLKNNKENSEANSKSSVLALPVNLFKELNQNNESIFKLDASSSWVHKIRRHNWKTVQANFNVGYIESKRNYEWNNSTRYIASGNDIINHQFQNNENKSLRSLFTLSTSQRLWKQVYMEPKISSGINYETLKRNQGNVDSAAIDSLSPDFQNPIYSLAAAVSLKNGSKKQQWNIGLEAQKIWMQPTVNDNIGEVKDFQYLLPHVYWRRELGQSKSLEINYNTQIQTPSPKELLPILFYSSPLSGIRGSLDLKPEFHHNFNFNFIHFNQFELSSLVASISGTYIKDKIGTAIVVQPNLSQQAQWVNTDYSGNIRINGSYSRPIKKLKIGISFEATEILQFAESPINNVSNKNTTLTHLFNMTINNKKNNDKWNARLGIEVQISDSRYSINSEYNNVFVNYTGFGFVSYQPNKNWLFSIDTKLKYYTAQSFSDDISVPLLGAELTRYFLPMQRASITLKAFDLLNKNQAVIRQGQRNYLVEQSSNVISRYFLLSFSYKLKKVGK